MKYSIQSKYILYKDQLISGYVCIEGEFIKYILHEPNELLNEYPIKYVYENQVLMAAAIDTNVSLSMWNHIEEFTKLAIVGGTSLIVNKPYQLNLDMDANETYQIQIQQLSLKSQTDFIQMAKIIHKEDVHTQIDQLMKQGAFCFDSYLLPSYTGTYFKDLQQLQQVLQLLPSYASLFIHTQTTVDKDLGITSPFRSKSFPERLNITQLDLVDADGVSGSCISDDENLLNDDPKYLQQMDYLDESNSPIKEIVKKYKNSDEQRIQEFDYQYDTPQSPKLQSNIYKLKSKQITEQSQISLISRAELITYKEAPKMEQNYKFPYDDSDSIQSQQQQQQQQQQLKQQYPSYKLETKLSTQDQESPLGSKKDSNQQDSNQKHSPQMSIQSSDLSSPESLSLKSECRLRSRAQTTQGLLQRRQSKTGFALVLHQVEDKSNGKHGSGDMLLLNFSESRPRQNQNNNNRFNKDYLCFLAFRPATWEKFAIQKVKKVIKQQFKCNIIFNGFSSSFSLVEIKELLNNQIFSDIGYPYLLLDSDDISDGVTKFKSDPPIRQKYNKQLLQKAISQNNWISSISSSHLYVNGLYKFEEQGDFRKAVSGLCSLGCTFQALWTLLFCKKNQDPNIIKQVFYNQDKNNSKYKRMVLKLIQLQQLVSTGPAQYLNLKDRGCIEVGKVADLVVFDPLKAWKLNFEKINHIFTFSTDKHIFKNRLFLGSVDSVFIRGENILHQENQIISIQNRKGIQIIQK
ncbi:unnamed protein product [Paramecium sonneborni]|uniref:Amidohydrolase-related domain-containing protein n=1 Tax=Paramecium sonneborni TaxID=65129 RepID=A0A8S1KRG0_9CILI|nr:unnamed protein product [Paramecium sonneborni]